MDTFKWAYTYDDVLLVPQRSDVVPRDVDISTRLTQHIFLNSPLISADMDTVTESEMAIAMAQEGGIGIIHKNISPKLQAREVAIVKRSESGVISHPITLSPDNTVAEAFEVMKEKGISGIPIVKDRKVVGILTRRDLRFEKNLEKKVEDVMTREVITAPVGTTPEDALEILQKHRIEKIPLVDADHQLAGLITIKDIQKKLDYPLSAKDENGRLLVGASIGVGDEAMDRLDRLVAEGVDVAVISTAHGHSQGVIDTVKRVREKYSQLEIIAGNVVTKEGVRELIEAGVTGVKVGVGPGSICTTRIIAGVGVPQLTAIQDCVEEAQKYDVPIIADGGIRYSGDIVKALAAGAETVMAGGLFAGTEESPGEIVHHHGKTYKSYRGMGSEGALENGSKDRYAQKDVKKGKLVPEGVEGQVIYKGMISDVVYQLHGGIKSGCGYVGAKNIRELQKRAQFVSITQASLQESHPHDIFITNEAPNYSHKQ